MNQNNSHKKFTEVLLLNQEEQINLYVYDITFTFIYNILVIASYGIRLFSRMFVMKCILQYNDSNKNIKRLS